MTASDDEADRLVINIPAYLLRQRGEAEAEQRQPAGDFHAFARTGIQVIQVQRDTEHGVTPVQSLGFAKDEERLAVLGLLDLPALYDRLPRLYDYLRDMGCGSDPEPRYFAALAVSVLARQLPFADLKAEILSPWAKSEHAGCMDSAAIALAETLVAGRCEADILALLRHWAKTDNPNLIQVAMGALTWRFDKARGDAALDVIESILTWRSDKAPGDATQDAIESMTKFAWMWLLFPPIRELFRRVFDAEPETGIRALRRWIEPYRDDPLRLLSALLALEFLQIEDAVDSEDLLAVAVELIGTLWDDPRLPLHAIVQEETTAKVKDWADRALALLDEEKLALYDPYRQFFLALQARYRGQRRDRLRFHIERWDRLRERTARRRASRPGADKRSSMPHRPYRDLLTPD